MSYTWLLSGFKTFLLLYQYYFNQIETTYLYKQNAKKINLDNTVHLDPFP